MPNEEASKKTLKVPIKLVIASAFYEVKAYSPYIVALLGSIRLLNELGIEWDYYEISGDSYVDRAKNTLANRFMDSDATHLMIIDSDMYWDISGFGRMIKHIATGCPLVGAAYPCKNIWSFFGCFPNIDKETGQVKGKEYEGGRLLDMHVMPGGFIIYSRQALEMTKPFLKTYYDMVNDITYYEYFKCNIEDGNVRIGEDVYFQIRYKEAGGIVWLEPDVTIKHMGIKAWEGNYHQMLLNKIGSKEVTPLTVPDYGEGKCE
jgi:hypothetical protein